MSKTTFYKAILTGMVLLFVFILSAQYRSHCMTSVEKGALHKSRPGSKMEAEKSYRSAEAYFSLKNTRAVDEYMVSAVYYVYKTNFNINSVTVALQKTNEGIQNLRTDQGRGIVPELWC